MRTPMKITLTELRQLLAEDALVAALLVERAALRQQIIDLLAGDAALQAAATAAFDKSEATEAKMRAGLPAQP